MFKRRGLIAIIGLALLNSCSIFPLRFTPYTPLAASTVSHERIEGPGYYRPASYSLDYNEIYRSNPLNRRINLRAKGEQKLLVLPIEFPSYPLAQLDQSNGDKSRIIIQNAFFGTETTTQWESVASFYNKSSYGQLSITGDVAPWYQPNNDDGVLNDIAKIDQGLTSVSNTTVSQKILRQAVAAYKVVNPNISEFDADQDGIIDAVFMIYSHPISRGAKEHEFVGANELYWAYASHDTRSDSPTPKANAYAWASYDFLNITSSLQQTLPDAHTLIHEAGHLFGLQDYYNTSSRSNSLLYAPTGGADMMDYSLGDHTAYSKMVLDWIKPYRITGPSEITLAPLATSGEVALIATNWNESPFDEYLLLEYYVPRNLNRFDANVLNAYRLPTRYGLKVYHVDARLVTRTVTINETPQTYQEIQNNNSPSQYDANNNRPVLYRLLDKRGLTELKAGGVATDQSLYYLGDDFGVTYYPDFQFNQGGELPFTFEITKVAKTGITIRFSTR